MRKFAVALLAAITAATLCGAVEVVGQTAVADDVRISVLTPTLLRMEHSPARRFVDEPSALVVQRALGPVDFTAEEHGGLLVVRTEHVTLLYALGSGPFSAENLLVDWHYGGKWGTWTPGQPDTANLGGTRTSLDGIGEHNIPDMGEGMLSRRGCTLVADEGRVIWDSAAQWFAPRPDPDALDWYLFVYGHDYPHCLSEYTQACGSIPMLPEWAFGSWYSRYWPFSDADLREIVGRFRELGIPLDILVIDVDWHLYGWTGYDWNPDYFAQPEEFLAWCREQGLHTTLNDHPGIVPAADSHYVEAATKIGLDKIDEREAAGFDFTMKNHAEVFMDVLHLPLLDQGADFWWIDGAVAGPMGKWDLLTTNRVFYEAQQEHLGERTLVFSRYGGLGNHRYPISFSGDTHSQWAVLEYEVPYTATAGNVGIPYWTHDIGGFLGNKIDDELFIRWVQFGCLSPMMRLHSNHGVREPWNYSEEALAISRDFMRLRQRLMPYIYSCSAEVTETGMPLCRPLYLHWPEEEEAYSFGHEYMFGPSMLFAPVTRPGGRLPVDVEVYFPPGIWYDFFTGESYAGPSMLNQSIPLERTGLFAKAGAVIPMQPYMDYVGQKAVDPLTLRVYSGGDGSFTLYEDDGRSLDYRSAAFAKTPMTACTDPDGSDLTLAIGPTQGMYEGQAERRGYVVEIIGRLLPEAVSVNGKAIPRADVSVDGPADCWQYDAGVGLLSVGLSERPIANEVELTLRGGGEEGALRLRNALASYRRTLERARSMALRSDAVGGVAAGPSAEFAAAAQGLLESTNAENLRDTIADLDRAYAKALRRIAGSGTLKESLDAAWAEMAGMRLRLRAEPGDDGEHIVFTAMLGSESASPEVSGSLWINPPAGWRKTGGPIGLSFGSLEPATVARHTMETVPAGVLPLGPIRASAAATLRWREWTFVIEEDITLSNDGISEWNLIGPFPGIEGASVEPAPLPEPEVDFDAAYETETGEARAWRKLSWVYSGTGSQGVPFINLRRHISGEDDVIGYAATYIYSPQQRQVLLRIGSDDGCIVWLNGAEVIRAPEPRGAQLDQNVEEVTLTAGWNELLLKIAQGPGDWGLYCTISDLAGNPPEDIYYASRPVEDVERFIQGN